VGDGLRGGGNGLPLGIASSVGAGRLTQTSQSRLTRSGAMTVWLRYKVSFIFCLFGLFAVGVWGVLCLG
jgi:hypothetical protein